MLALIIKLIMALLHIYSFSLSGDVIKQLLSEPKKCMITFSESIDDRISCK